MSGQISFATSREAADAISQIVARAEKIARRHDVPFDAMTMSMDLMACHCNGCPLDLLALYTFPDSDFGHDVFGIRAHIDRKTGKLTDCFLPRCAERQAATV